MFFFRAHPTIPYRIPGQTKSVQITDITRRFSVANFISNASVTFDEYYVQDGERPDHVAYDYYDDYTLDWLVLMTNEIQDPYYEWPLSYEQFNSMIMQKYRGFGVNDSINATLSYVNQTIHHYEKILQKNYVASDGAQVRVYPEKTVTIDYATYATLPAPEKKAVSIYEYEHDLNEERRHIYLLDLHFVHIIKDQHPYIFEEGPYIR
jgi:hypothetical protein